MPASFLFAANALGKCVTSIAEFKTFCSTNEHVKKRFNELAPELSKCGISPCEIFSIAIAAINEYAQGISATYLSGASNNMIQDLLVDGALVLMKALLLYKSRGILVRRESTVVLTGFNSRNYFRTTDPKEAITVSEWRVFDPTVWCDQVYGEEEDTGIVIVDPKLFDSAITGGIHGKRPGIAVVRPC